MTRKVLTLCWTPLVEYDTEAGNVAILEMGKCSRCGAENVANSYDIDAKHWHVDQDAINEKLKGLAYMLDRLDSNIDAQKMFDLDMDWLVLFWQILESAEKGVLSVEERLELWR